MKGPDVSQHVPDERDGEDGNVSIYGDEDVIEAESEVEQWATVDVRVGGEDVNEGGAIHECGMFLYQMEWSLKFSKDYVKEICFSCM